MKHCEQCGEDLSVLTEAALARHPRGHTCHYRADLNRAVRMGYGPVPPLARSLMREFGMEPVKLPYTTLDGAVSEDTFWRRTPMLRRDELASLAQQAAEDCGDRSPTYEALQAVVAALDEAAGGEPFVLVWGRSPFSGTTWGRRWAPADRGHGTPKNRRKPARRNPIVAIANRRLVTPDEMVAGRRKS